MYCKLSNGWLILKISWI